MTATPPTTTLRYAMTLDDLVDGNRFVSRPIRRFGTLMGAVVGTAGVAVLITSPGWLGLAMIVYGLLDLALLWFRPLERLLLRRRVAQLVGNDCEVSVTEDALAFRQAGMTGEFAWSTLTGLREDSRTLAVVSGGVVRMGIPKRVFNSESEAVAFRQVLATKIADAQRHTGQ